MRIGLQWEKFQRILPFQSEFFSQTHNTPFSDITLSTVTQCLSQLLSDDKPFNVPNKNSSNISVYFNAEESGCMMACLEYQHKSDDGILRTNIAVIVGEICIHSRTNDSLAIIPHYFLVGERKTANGHDVFVPEAVSCRQIEDGKAPVMVEWCENDEENSPNDEGYLSEFFCYADECFRRISAGLPIDTAAAQAWMNVSDDALDKRMDFLISRTEKQLAAEIS